MVAAAGGSCFPVMVLARLVTMVVRAWSCWASLALKGALPAMFGIGIHDCLLVVGIMVELAVFAVVHRLAG